LAKALLGLVPDPLASANGNELCDYRFYHCRSIYGTAK
jgi:hypothetical protein